MDQYHSYAAAAGDHSLPFNGQFEWPQAAYHQHHYSNLSDGSSDYTQHSFTYGSGVSTEAFEDFEDGEHEGRARLTGEQMAELERQFSSEPMPKTDRKAEIARKLRLNVPRVSNWYQNRRAKAKHQKILSGDKDALSAGGAAESPERSLSAAGIDFHMPGEMSYGSMPQNAHAPVHGGFDFGQLGGSMSGFDFGLDSRDEGTGHMHDAAQYSDGLATAISPQTSQSVSATWLANSVMPTVPQPFAAPSIVQQSSSKHSPQSSDGLLSYEATHEQLNKKFDAATIGIYHNSIANLGLNTHPVNVTSPDVDFAHYLTPPHEPPALPWMNDEQAGRRTSDSSELASDFANNCQVRQPSLGLAMAESTVNPSSVLFPFDASTPTLTPDVSPVQGPEIPSPLVGDLATRRKAQRPAPLVRPQPNRSVSHGAPPSMSPRARTQNHSLRTSQSHSVLNGRVSKPGSGHASPRHQQTQFDIRPGRDGHRGHNSISSGAGGTSIDLGSLAQPSSAASNQSYHSWLQRESGMTTTHHPFYNNTSAFSSVPDLSVHKAHAQDMSIQHMRDGMTDLQAFEFGCPQSAPSHQTTFQFPEATPAQGNQMVAHAWVPSQPHALEFSIEPSNLPLANQSAHNSFSNAAYQPPFAPKTHMGILPGDLTLGSSAQHPLLTYGSTVPPPPTEFKTELETKPGQIFVKPTAKDFNFSNSTPKDFNTSSGKRK